MRSRESGEVKEFIQKFIDGTYKRKKQYSQHFIKDEFPFASFLMFGASDGTILTCAKIEGACDTFPALYLWQNGICHTSDFSFPNVKPVVSFSYNRWEQNGLDITEAKIIDYNGKLAWLLQVDRSKVLIERCPGQGKTITYPEYIGDTWHYLESDIYRTIILGGSEASTVEEARIECIPEEARKEDSMMIMGLWTAKANEGPPIITPTVLEAAKRKPWAEAWDLPSGVVDHDDNPTQRILTSSVNVLETEFGRENAVSIKDFRDAWNEWNSAASSILNSKGSHLLDNLPIYPGKSLECFKDSCGEICIKGEVKNTQWGSNHNSTTFYEWTKLLLSKGEII